MAFCSKCGAPIGEGARFCASCGAPFAPTTDDGSFAQSDAQGAEKNKEQRQNSAYGATPPPNSRAFDPADIAENKAMGILAYLGFLVFIPLFAAKNSRYARFHTNQGLILFILEAAISLLTWIIPGIFLSGFYFWGVYRLLDLVFDILSLGCFGLTIYGIVNAAQGKRKELPIIGKLRIIKE